MQIGTLKLVRTALACLFFISVLLIALILKLIPVVQFSAAEGDGSGLKVTAVIAAVSLIGWIVSTLALGRRERNDPASRG